jgi:tetratricopeptide (TPR) repeat protein
MWRIKNFFKLAISLVGIFLAGELAAQTIDEAKSLYNEGGTAMQEGNTEIAVQKFADCLTMCETLYEEQEDLEAEELSNNIKPILPKLYLQLARTKAKEKDLSGGLDYAAKAKNSAHQYGDEATVAEASDLASKLNYAIGLSNYKAEKLDDALIYLNSAIKEDNNNLKAHYLKVVVLKTKEDESALIEATKQMMAINSQDENTVKAISTTGNYFYNKGVLAKQSSQYEQAIAYINTSLEYSKGNADAYYILTSVYNSKSDWAKAISSANEGLKCEAAGNEARFYFELGNSYLGKGDNTAACNAYSKVIAGEYLEAAKYQIEHVVKCQ